MPKKGIPSNKVGRSSKQVWRSCQFPRPLRHPSFFAQISGGKKPRNSTEISHHSWSLHLASPSFLSNLATPPLSQRRHRVRWPPAGGWRMLGLVGSTIEVHQAMVPEIGHVLYNTIISWCILSHIRISSVKEFRCWMILVDHFGQICGQGAGKWFRDHQGVTRVTTCFEGQVHPPNGRLITLLVNGCSSSSSLPNMVNLHVFSSNPTWLAGTSPQKIEVSMGKSWKIMENHPWIRFQPATFDDTGSPAWHKTQLMATSEAVNQNSW